MNPNDKEFQNQLTKSIGKDSIELGVDFLEEVVDGAVTTSGIARDIPVVGTIVGLIRAGVSVRDYSFSKKIIRFINETNKSGTSDELSAFAANLESNPELKKRTISTVCIIVDRLFDEGYAVLLAGVFSAYIASKMSWEQFVQISFELEKLNLVGIDGLKELADARGARSYFQQRRTLPLKISVLIGSGFVDYENSTFRLNSLGVLFVAHGLKYQFDPLPR